MEISVLIRDKALARTDYKVKTNDQLKVDPTTIIPLQKPLGLREMCWTFLTMLTVS